MVIGDGLRHTTTSMEDEGTTEILSATLLNGRVLADLLQTFVPHISKAFETKRCSPDFIVDWLLRTDSDCAVARYVNEVKYTGGSAPMLRTILAILKLKLGSVFDTDEVGGAFLTCLIQAITAVPYDQAVDASHSPWAEALKVNVTEVAVQRLRKENEDKIVKFIRACQQRADARYLPGTLNMKQSLALRARLKTEYPNENSTIFRGDFCDIVSTILYPKIRRRCPDP